MKFCIEVGEIRKHRIEYDFNQLLGRLIIRLDRKEVMRNTRLFNEPIRETHRVQVAETELVAVRIEKERRQLFGQKCRVFLNERLYKLYQGT